MAFRCSVYSRRSAETQGCFLSLSIPGHPACLPATARALSATVQNLPTAPWGPVPRSWLCGRPLAQSHPVSLWAGGPAWERTMGISARKWGPSPLAHPLHAPKLTSLPPRPGRWETPTPCRQVEHQRPEPGNVPICHGTDTPPSCLRVCEDSEQHTGSDEGSSGHPCLTPGFKREAPAISPTSLRFAGCLLGTPQQVKAPLCFSFAKSFSKLTNGCRRSSDVVPASDGMGFFRFNLLKQGIPPTGFPETRHQHPRPSSVPSAVTPGCCV